MIRQREIKLERSFKKKSLLSLFFGFHKTLANLTARCLSETNEERHPPIAGTILPVIFWSPLLCVFPVHSYLVSFKLHQFKTICKIREVLSNVESRHAFRGVFENEHHFRWYVKLMLLNYFTLLQYD